MGLSYDPGSAASKADGLMIRVRQGSGHRFSRRFSRRDKQGNDPKPTHDS